MNRFKFLPIVTFASVLSAGFLPITSHQAFALSVVPGYPYVLCDEEYVQADEQELAIFVKPTNVDDTDNIQCALDEAVRMGVPRVQLDRAKYWVSSISVENFQGSLQGYTKNSTEIEVLDGSIDCSAFSVSNRAPAAFKFIGGEPRVRYMKMKANNACNDGGRLTAILHFTGAAASESECANDVIFGNVDRVILDGTNRTTGPKVSISAQPEAYLLHQLKPQSCNRHLAGTFKLNRSELMNTQFGIATTMRASAQVDISFNTFENNDASVWIENANQRTSVSRNTMLGLRSRGDLAICVGQSVFTEGGDVPPPASRLDVSENTLKMEPFDDEESLGIYVAGKNRTNIGTVIARNTLRLQLQAFKGIWATDLINGHLSENAFINDDGNGSLIDAVEIDATEDMSITGWTISGNEFDEFRANLMGATSGNFIGPNQGASILDLGLGNIVMEEGNFMMEINQQNRLQQQHSGGGVQKPAETDYRKKQEIEEKVLNLSRSLTSFDR